MSQSYALVYPVLAQVLWTFILMLWTGQVRIKALRRHTVRLRDIALDGGAWPNYVKKVSNNMHNQFETPILFFALCGIATYVGATGVAMISFAWAYFASRLVHTAIHTTTNRVQHRVIAFAVGWLVLVLMWIAVVLKLGTA